MSAAMMAIRKIGRRKNVCDSPSQAHALSFSSVRKFAHQKVGIEQEDYKTHLDHCSPEGLLHHWQSSKSAISAILRRHLTAAMNRSLARIGDSTPMLESSIQELVSGALARIASAGALEELEPVRVEVLGRKGAIDQFFKQMGRLAPEERARAGKLLNDAKRELEARGKKGVRAEGSTPAWTASGWTSRCPRPAPAPAICIPSRRSRRRSRTCSSRWASPCSTAPKSKPSTTTSTPSTFPPDHPARDMQDTFWLDRRQPAAHPHVARAGARHGAAGAAAAHDRARARVFRNESVDASHEHTFYQLEGMMIDRDVSVAHLIYFMKTLLGAVFQREVTVRLRPGYFPFVEPGFELDIQCLICGGAGCPVCKQSGWVELLPCGLVHPNVLRMSGIDPEEWNGFAFGLGLTRLVMMRYGIDDIRQLQGGDLRFLNQF